MRDRPVDIPDTPGSYQFKDDAGRIIYVGKARSLRSRLSSYFVDPRFLHPRTAQMVATAATVEWIQVASDTEAIMLEYNLIKTHRPRFNIRLVDDKSYPYLAITTDEEWPRPMVMRGARRKGVRYFGPYARAYAIRETLDLLLRSFPIRTCSPSKFHDHERLGRPCLLFHIERCSGPCVGSVKREDYDRSVAGLMAFLDGDTAPIERDLATRMQEASDALEFELAARLRDQLESVRHASERQEMVASAVEDFDVIGIVDEELEAAAQVLHVRRGRVVGRAGFIVEKVEPLNPEELCGRVIEQHYAESPIGVPPTLYLPQLPESSETFAKWLSDRRGGPVRLSVPQRGRKRHLLTMAETNGGEQLLRHRLRRSSDLTSRAKALDQLQVALGLSEAPLRIECYDMSHLQGTDYVGSMVVMEDGLPKRSDYRHFKVTAVAGNDDYGAMAEVLTRRLRRLDEPEQTRETGRPTRFSYPPQLILLDGGKGQLSVGIRVLEELGLTNRLSLASLAKQYEEVFVPGRADPIRIPRDSEAIYLLQQIRDEAHRFAITYHRKLRGKRMTTGILDEIAGLGPKRKKRLTTELGGVRAVRTATLEQLTALDWLPDAVAHAVFARLHPEAPLSSSMTTRPATIPEPDEVVDEVEDESETEAGNDAEVDLSDEIEASHSQESEERLGLPGERESRQAVSEDAASEDAVSA